MKVMYTGTANLQTFYARDFDKAGVKAHKTEFPRGVEVEVDKEVGKALTSTEGVFGDYSFSEVKPSKAGD